MFKSWIYIVAMKEGGGGNEGRGWGRGGEVERINIWINIWFSGGAA